MLHFKLTLGWIIESLQCIYKKITNYLYYFLTILLIRFFITLTNIFCISVFIDQIIGCAAYNDDMFCQVLLGKRILFLLRERRVPIYRLINVYKNMANL